MKHGHMRINIDPRFIHALRSCAVILQTQPKLHIHTNKGFTTQCCHLLLNVGIAKATNSPLVKSHPFK